MIILKDGIVESIFKNEKGTWTVKVKSGRISVTYDAIKRKPLISVGQEVFRGDEIVW